MPTPSLPRHIAAFLHAVRSSPVEELRAASVALATVPGDRLLAALVALDRVTREHGADAAVRTVVNEARRVAEHPGDNAGRRPDMLSHQDADRLQLMVEWCAVALMLVEALPADAFATFWKAFAPIVMARMLDAKATNSAEPE